MPSAYEIACAVKYAAAYMGFILFHFLRSRKFHNPSGLFHIAQQYFIVPARLVEQLKAEEGKNIWICGGAQTARQLMRAGLVEEYRLTVAPVILGAGIPLFEEGVPEKRLSLCRAVQRGSLVELVYWEESSVR